MISGDAGVTIGGRIFAGGAQSGSVQITSSAGLVTMNQEVRANGDSPSTITLNGAAGVDMNHNIKLAGRLGPGGALAISSSTGDVVMNKKVRIKGMDGGSVVVTAPLGEVDQRGIDAKGRIDGGSVTIVADTITVHNGIDTEGGFGNGGTIALTASTLVTVAGNLEAHGQLDGGTISLLGDAASGDVTVTRTLKASGGFGNGGVVVVSAPAGAVSLGKIKIEAFCKGALGGGVFVDGVALTVGPKARIDADGQIGGGEIRFAQSGAGTFLLAAGLEARDGGIIEALAPAGTLTVDGRLSAGPAGCIGLSAATLDLGAANPDVPIPPSCP